HRDAARFHAGDRQSRRERLPRRHPAGRRCRRSRVGRPRPGSRTRIGGTALRRRADGGRIPRPLSARRRTPPQHRDRHRGRPLNEASRREPFRVGVNYWPAATAMGWWSSFDPVEVEADFARIAASGLDSVRVFLTWEDFQPTPGLVDREMLARLLVVAAVAAGLGLALIPTLFTGHMSGVNWIPPWALGGSEETLASASSPAAGSFTAGCATGTAIRWSEML